MSFSIKESVFPILFLASLPLFVIPEAAHHGRTAHAAAEPEAHSGEWQKLDLVATAYNSVPAQTDSTPDIAAWGDKLKPGMKAIAVSRDLLRMGLKRGSRVWISGLEGEMKGEYVVLDKMITT